MRPMAAKAGMARPGMAALLSALAWLAGTCWAEAGVNRWTTNGPEGTSVRVFAVDPTDTSTLYASTPQGVSKSTDGGRTWSFSATLPSGNRYRPSPPSCLAIDPLTPTNIYAGTDDGSFSYEGGVGIFKSADGGESWKPLSRGLPRWSNNLITPVRSLAIDPGAPTTLYAGTGSGVFKSTDGGELWVAANAGLTNTYVLAVAIDPWTPTTLYASTSGGIFKSTNGGGSWVAASSGSSVAFITFLRVDPQTPTTLYAGSAQSNFGAAKEVPLFKSTDGGTSWAAINNGLHGGSYWWAVSDLAIDPATPTNLYAAMISSSGSGGAVFKSTDGGGSWAPVDTGLSGTTAGALTIDPRSPSTLYLGTFTDGAFKSTDGGESWNAINTGLPGRHISCLSIDPQTPTTLYAGSYVRSSAYTYRFSLYKSTDGGSSWGLVGNGGGCPLLIDPQTPTTMYTRAYQGVSKSTDGGATWRSFGIGLGLYPGDITDLAIDPRTPTTLYVGAWSKPGIDRQSEGLFKSTDGGETWVRIIGASLNYLNTIYTLVVDPQTSAVIAGTHQGVLGGLGCGGRGMPYYFIDGLAIDSGTPRSLYAIVRGGLFKCTEGTGSWVAINDGLPPYIKGANGSGDYYSVSGPSIDPLTSTTLYVRNWDGLYKSTDWGGTWVPFDYPGLTNISAGPPVIDPVNPAILHAATTAGVFTLEQRPNRRPVAEAGTDMTVECAGAAGTEVALDAGRSSDPDGDALSYAWTGPFGRVEGSRPTVTLPLGVSTITLVVSDGELESDPAVVVVDVRDTVAPTLEVAATPTLLWPPDGRMVEVTLQVATSDRCDSSPEIVLLDAKSNEPQDAARAGPTITDADSGTDDRSIFLRAERSSNGPDRIYTITYRATDTSGNAATVAAVIKVPHDQRR